jgi:Golgi to ER traffic protein 4
VSQQKLDEAVELLKDGALALLKASQISSGADLALLLLSSMEKASTPVNDKNIGKSYSS